MRKGSILAITLMTLALAVAAGCGPNPRIMNSAEPTPEEPINIGPRLSPFEADVQAMRNADYEFIYVVRRKDGGKLDAEDRAFINETTPPQTNRRTLSDEGRAAIFGTNFKFPDEAIEKLGGRFDLEDLSMPVSKERISPGSANDSN
jgi:hypothetical protein